MSPLGFVPAGGARTRPSGRAGPRPSPAGLRFEWRGGYPEEEEAARRPPLALFQPPSGPSEAGSRAGAGVEVAVDEREVFAADLALADHPSQRGVCCRRLREDHQARGVTVQAVNDAWPEVLAASAAEHLDERHTTMPRRRMDDEAGG